MTFVQNFWNRWNANHLAFVREMRQNIVDMFVNDNTKVKKCPSNIDKVRRDRDRNTYWDSENGRINRNRSSCSVRSVSRRRSSRSVCRGAVEEHPCGGSIISRPSSKRYYVDCGDKVPYCGDENQWNCTNWCEFVIIITLTVLCMVGAMAGTIYWVMTYHGDIKGPWDEETKGDKLMYFHPVGMVTGFIFFCGFAILVFRLCRCCRRLCAKLIHLLLHLLGGVCIGLGAWSIYKFGEERTLHLYSLHSWCGIAAIALYALQFVFGIFFFLILLFCEGPTACCRASVVPIHSALGLAAYIMAICACLTALAERTVTILGNKYKTKIMEGSPEHKLMNGIAAALILLAILIIYICRRESFRYRYQARIC